MIVESDGWAEEGRNILAPETLAKIEEILEHKGPIILVHWFYRGASAPDRLVFDSYENFLTYLTSKARPGDAFDVWDFAELCKNDNRLADGKYPDSRGRTPRGGAY